MPITQPRMLSVIAGWRATYNKLKDARTDIQEAYDRAIKTNDWETLGNEVFMLLRNLSLTPEQIELLVREEEHFRHNKYKNNYMQRRMAQRRKGTSFEQAERLLEGPNFGAKNPIPENFRRNPPPQHQARPFEPRAQSTAAEPTIAPPDTDHYAEVLQQSFSEQLGVFGTGNTDELPPFDECSDLVKERFYNPDRTRKETP